jgi:hypothetical protein
MLQPSHQQSPANQCLVGVLAAKQPALPLTPVVHTCVDIMQKRLSVLGFHVRQVQAPGYSTLLGWAVSKVYLEQPPTLGQNEETKALCC